MGSIHESLRYFLVLAIALVAVPLAPGATSDAASVSFEPPRLEPVRELLEARYHWLDTEEVRLIADAIVDEAHTSGLAPELVAAVIHVESSCNRYAVSHAGAMGLMQLLPNTAASVAGRAGVAWDGPETLFDPVANVRLGVSYLDELVDRFGDIHVALAAYNWGPTRIARKLRNGDELPAGYTDRVLEVYDTLI